MLQTDENIPLETLVIIIFLSRVEDPIPCGDAGVHVQRSLAVSDQARALADCERQAAASTTPRALKEFERFDKDNDGELDEKELHKMFDRWATPTPSVSFATFAQLHSTRHICLAAN